MIDLTPIDVRKKKGDFRRAVRGYDTDLVDDFLDLVAERLEELVKQNMALSDRLTRIEEQVGEYRQRDRALTEALVTAQEVREEVRRQAEKDAALKHREAEADAASIRAEAAAAREREEESLRRLRARRLHMIQSFRTFLERELNELAVTQEALELEAPLEAMPPAPPKAPRRRVTSELDEPHMPERAPADADDADGGGDDDVRDARGTGSGDAAGSTGDAGPPNASGTDDAEDGPDWLSSIMEEKP